MIAARTLSNSDRTAARVSSNDWYVREPSCISARSSSMACILASSHSCCASRSLTMAQEAQLLCLFVWHRQACPGVIPCGCKIALRAARGRSCDPVTRKAHMLGKVDNTLHGTRRIEYNRVVRLLLGVLQTTVRRERWAWSILTLVEIPGRCRRSYVPRTCISAFHTGERAAVLL